LAVETAFEKQLLRDGVVDEARLTRARQEAAGKGIALMDAM